MASGGPSLSKSLRVPKVTPDAGSVQAWRPMIPAFMVCPTRHLVDMHGRAGVGIDSINTLGQTGQGCFSAGYRIDWENIQRPKYQAYLNTEGISGMYDEMESRQVYDTTFGTSGVRSRTFGYEQNQTVPAVQLLGCANTPQGSENWTLWNSRMTQERNVNTNTNASRTIADSSVSLPSH